MPTPNTLQYENRLTKQLEKEHVNVMTVVQRSAHVRLSVSLHLFFEILIQKRGLLK